MWFAVAAHREDRIMLVGPILHFSSSSILCSVSQLKRKGGGKHHGSLKQTEVKNLGFVCFQGD